MTEDTKTIFTANGFSDARGTLEEALRSVDNLTLIVSELATKKKVKAGTITLIVDTMSGSPRIFVTASNNVDEKTLALEAMAAFGRQVEKREKLAARIVELEDEVERLREAVKTAGEDALEDYIQNQDI